MDLREALLALHLTGVIGPRRLLASRKAFPRLSDLFGASEETLAHLPDWTPSVARKVLALENPGEVVARELEKSGENGIRVLVEGDAAFPKVFENLYDPPFVLWMRGEWRDEEKSMAVVGCRKPSAYGKTVARQLSEQLCGYGYTVVSGMARGIDTAAHEGALSHPQGRTVAFLGSGLLELYPPENAKLAERIAERGALVSEYPLNARPLALHFPQRNRLISGAAKGVLVVEAGEGSGSLITVDHALEQGKTVFAVPGPIDNSQSLGTHELIRQGAKLVMRAEDVLQEFGELVREYQPERAPRGPRPDDLTAEEKNVMERLSYAPLHMDELARESGLNTRRLSELMLVLEMRGFAKQTPGNRYVKT